MNIKKWMNLFQKDVRDSLTEKTSLLMISVSIVFEIILNFLSLYMEFEYPYTANLLMCSVFNLAILPMCIFPLLVAEEKEKQTASVLYRMGISERAFLMSKAAAAVAVELAVGVLLCLIVGIGYRLILVHALCNLFAAIALLPFGGIVAIYAADKNSVNVYCTAGVLFMMMAPIFSVAGGKLLFLNRWLPSCLVTEVYLPLMLEITPGGKDIVSAAGVTLAWFVGGMLIFYILYRKNGLRIRYWGMK